MIEFLIALLIYGYQQLPRYEPEAQPEVQVESLYQDRATPTPTPKENTGLASWYDRSVCGKRIYGVNCRTANGEIFDEEAFTMACDRRFPLGSKFRITYNENTIEAKCTDRGDFAQYGRLFDLSRGAFSKLADLSKGVVKITWELKSK